jgi:hypothetical protein
MYVTHTLPVGGLRTWQPFTLTQQSRMDTIALERKGLPATSLARQLTDPRVPTQFLSPHSH